MTNTKTIMSWIGKAADEIKLITSYDGKRAHWEAHRMADHLLERGHDLSLAEPRACARQIYCAAAQALAAEARRLDEERMRRVLGDDSINAWLEGCPSRTLPSQSRTEAGPTATERL